MQFTNDLIGNDKTSMFNSNGHRCAEIQEINLRKHILILGDTAGLELNKPVDQTFPHILSKKLNIDYYNLSVINGGVDVLKYNLYTWLFKFGSPKHIIIACEYVNALHVADANLEHVYPADLQDLEIQSLNDHANYCGFFTARNHFNDLLLSHVKGIQVYQLTWKSKVSAFKKSISISCDDMNQLGIAEALCAQIQNRTKKVMAV